MSEYTSRRHLRVLDVMTTEVITADPFSGFKEVAERLFDSGVSALPVVDLDGTVLGVISEDDLLVKEARQLETRSSLRRQKAKKLKGKAEAIVAAQAMTEPAITITPDATVAEAARTMHKRGLKRLPVVDSKGRLLGMVSRHDVIKVFTRSDESIRAEVIGGVLGRDMMIDTLGVVVDVEGGIVRLSGEVERRTQIPVITFLASGIDGVVGVDNTLTYRWDDTHVEYTGTVPRGIAGLA